VGVSDLDELDISAVLVLLLESTKKGVRVSAEDALQLTLAKGSSGGGLHEEVAANTITDFLPELFSSNIFVLYVFGGNSSKDLHGLSAGTADNDRVRSVELSPGLLQEHHPDFSFLSR
jgi:hypothetical protein